MKILIAAAAAAVMALAGCSNAGYGPAQKQSAGVGGAGTAGTPQAQQLPPMNPIPEPLVRGPRGNGMGAAAQDFVYKNVNELANPQQEQQGQRR